MQFHLSTIFLAAVVLATSLAMGNVAWVVLAIIVVACLAMPKNLITGVIAVALLALMGLCLMAAPDSARQAARRVHCSNNLRLLALGLLNYEAVYRTFPPAPGGGDGDASANSWRTHILRQLDEASLYQRYRFDEPWDGPNNIKLIQQRPRLLVCPSDQGAGAEATSYVAVVAPHSLWGKSIMASQRPSSEIVMLCEWPRSDIPWTEPRDLRREDVGRWLELVAYPHEGHPGGVNVAFADGHIEFLPWDDPEKVVQTLFHDRLTDDERRILEEYLAEREWQIRWRTLVDVATPIAWLASIIVMVIHLRAIRRKPAASADSPPAEQS